MVTCLKYLHECTEKIDIAEIMKQGISDYIMNYGKIPLKFKKVVDHICNCKTRALGGHVYQCDNCKTKRISYNSCRDRHCPKCQGVAQAVWVSKRISELLPTGYFHVVFTLPDSFNGISLKMKKPFYDILYRSAAETLLELGADRHWLGGHIGCMGILHTWGQKLLEHSHIHFIMPGGGIRLDDKKWISFRNDFLFPFGVMSRLFRGKFLDYFSKAVKVGKLDFPETAMPNGLNDFLLKQRMKEWNVYAEEPFGSAEQVVKYLGRYINRIAISNSRLISCENGQVTFTWKDYSDNNLQKQMTVSIVEFIHRYFLHILPDHFVRIRYFGILSNRYKNKKLERCFYLLNKRREKKRISDNSIAAQIYAVTGVDITLCSKCRKGHFVEVGEIMKIPDKEYFMEAA